MKKIWYIGNSFKSSFFERFNPAINYCLEFQRNPAITSPFTVRRVGDNVLYDAQFVNGVLDVVSLEAFANGNDCRVTEIRNQGFLPNQTNGFQITQPTVSSQPYIVRGGSVIRNSNGNVSLDFSGGIYYLQSAGNTANHGIRLLDTNCSVFNVFKTSNRSNLEHVFAESAGTSRISQSSEAGGNNRHTSYNPVGTTPNWILFYQTNQAQNTIKIQSFRRDNSQSNLIEAFDKDLNLVDSQINAGDYGGSGNHSLFLGALGSGFLQSVRVFEGLWNETVVLDNTANNAVMLDINNIFKNDYGVN
jgi:hypothetical protein